MISCVDIEKKNKKIRYAVGKKKREENTGEAWDCSKRSSMCNPQAHKQISRII